jgi:hypothetical protein
MEFWAQSWKERLADQERVTEHKSLFKKFDLTQLPDRIVFSLVVGGGLSKGNNQGLHGKEIRKWMCAEP